MRPVNRWLPQTVGLLAAVCAAVLATAPPGHPYTWLRLIEASVFVVLLTTLICAVAMFLAYILFPKEGAGQTIGRTCGTAACLGPLVILLHQESMWASVVAAFLFWTILPANVTPKAHWKKFLASIAASILLQIGIASALGEREILSALTLSAAAIPILWRIRQERKFRGPFQPAAIIAIALLLSIFGLTSYLPHGGGSGASDARASGYGKIAKNASFGRRAGGKYRGVILSPEAERHTILVAPLPMMGRDPFRVHKDPIGIPFYGVYWFFQDPDKAPNEDAYRVQGSPDNVTFRSADVTPLKMEAHQNLGRLIDLSACSGIDVVIRNADLLVGSVAMEAVLVNTRLPNRPFVWLGQAAIASKPPSTETLHFKIPSEPAIRQFDEITIRFPRARYRASRSARIAIERFFLVPRAR